MPFIFLRQVSPPSNTLIRPSTHRGARILYLVPIPSLAIFAKVGKLLLSRQNMGDQVYSTRDCLSSFALAFFGRRFRDSFDHNVDANATAQRVYLLYDEGVVMVVTARVTGDIRWPSIARVFLGEKVRALCNDLFDHNSFRDEHDADASTTANAFAYLLYGEDVVMTLKCWSAFLVSLLMIANISLAATLNEFGRRRRATWKGNHPP